MGVTSIRRGGWMLGPGEGEFLGPVDGGRDRLLVGREWTDGRVSLVEHLLPPRLLAAPLHFHTREDEISYVLEGRVGALLGHEEFVAEAGSVIYKPRREWHTFWNAGDVPARVLEVISPSGMDEAFRELAALGDALDPESLAEVAERYGCRVDFEGTGPIVERHALVF
jgi:mannose-6-phosphate isomerase-like protein (cupin superfamily)